MPSTTTNSKSNTKDRAPSALESGCLRGVPVPDKRDVSFFEAGTQLPESSSPGGNTFANPMIAIAAAMLDAEYYMRNHDGSCQHSVRLLGYRRP